MHAAFHGRNFHREARVIAHRFPVLRNSSSLQSFLAPAKKITRCRAVQLPSQLSGKSKLRHAREIFTVR